MPTFDHQVAAALKTAIAFAASALLAWRWWTTHRGRTPPRFTDPALAVLGVLAVAGWWNFGGFHFSANRVHYYEFFHYYLGAKYAPELGYTRLYDCAALADLENGHRTEVSMRWTRDLDTNELRRGSPVTSDPGLCRDHFSTAERWAEFKQDVQFFRLRMSPEKWLDVQMDHGYNASPLWTAVARPLADTGPVTESTIIALASLDVVLLVGMWGAVWWAFGWQTLCVALIWWGTSYPPRYSYVGGAFLRHDWLFFAILSLCLAKRGRMAGSGFALTLSALLRIFPALIAIGLLLKFGAEMLRTKRFAPDVALRRFAFGAIVAFAVAVPVSLTLPAQSGQPFATWREFAANTQRMAATSATNRVGLPVVISFDPANRSERIDGKWAEWPWDVWREGRRKTLSDRRWIQAACLSAFVLLLAVAVRRQEDWIALTLGVGVIPFFVEISNYYYSILMAFAFLWPRYHVAGLALAISALLSNLVLVPFSADDDRYTLISVVILALVLLVTGAVARRAVSSPIHHSAPTIT